MSKCFLYLFQCSRVQYDFSHYFVSEPDARYCRILVKGWFLFSTESTESSVYLTITNILYFLHNTFIVMPVSIHWLDSFCQRSTTISALPGRDASTSLGVSPGVCLGSVSLHTKKIKLKKKPIPGSKIEKLCAKTACLSPSLFPPFFAPSLFRCSLTFFAGLH